MGAIRRPEMERLIAKAKNIIEKTGRGSYAFMEPMFRNYLLREFF